MYISILIHGLLYVFINKLLEECGSVVALKTKWTFLQWRSMECRCGPCTLMGRLGLRPSQVSCSWHPMPPHESGGNACEDLTLCGSLNSAGSISAPDCSIVASLLTVKSKPCSIKFQIVPYAHIIHPLV